MENIGADKLRNEYTEHRKERKMKEYVAQGPQGTHKKVVVHKQQNKTPHQRITHNPHNTYTCNTKKKKIKIQPCNIIKKVPKK